MQKTTKNIILVSTIIGLLLIIGAVFCFSYSVDIAYADELADVTIVEQPTAFTLTYGSEGSTTLTTTLSNTNCIATYTWYKSETPTSVGVAVESSSSATISYTLKNVDETGYYYCRITKLTSGAENANVDLTTDRVLAKIMPKEVEIDLGENEYTYNGLIQTPNISIKEEDIIEGDEVKVQTAFLAVFKNAGNYEVDLSLSNSNYSILGDTSIVLTINKAKLDVSVEDKAVKEGSDYEFKLKYTTLLGNDTAESLGVNIYIPTSSYNYKSVGKYNILPEGPSETNNYMITYKPGNLFVDKAQIETGDCTGFTGTVSGMFRSDATFSMSEENINVPSIMIWNPISHKYHFTLNGTSDGDTYVINIQEEYVKAFLGVCFVDSEGKRHSVNNFKYADGVLSIELDNYVDGYIVIYHNLTLVLAIGIVLLLAILVMIIVKVRSYKKYRLKQYIYETAKMEADRYRNR